ncbi:MAG TPA: hypothetical protein VFZ78_04775 [Flavisolibacter sp.]
MAFRLDDIERDGVPVHFLSPGEVMVRVGPCSATALSSKKIPLDGRHYVCSGTIILKNGKRLRANFEINTHTFDFLERDTVTIYASSERAWYYITDPELWQLLGITEEDTLDYKWIPDVPLEYHVSPPYPMKWPT